MKKSPLLVLAIQATFATQAVAETTPYVDQLLSADWATLNDKHDTVTRTQSSLFWQQALSMKAQAETNTSSPLFLNALAQMPSLAIPRVGLGKGDDPKFAQNEQATPTESGIAQAEVITPLCTTLAINAGYTLNGTQTGGAYCYHFNLAARGKAVAFLLGQSESTDFRLSLLKHGDNDQLSLIGTSDQAGNADEYVGAVLEAGDYYWYMEAKQADNASIQFGVSVNPQIDSYEPNETPQTASQLPESRDMIVGNIDGASDVDYYLYTVNQGKIIDIGVDTSESPDLWLIGYQTVSGTFTYDEAKRRYNASEGAQLLVTVKHNPKQTVDPSKHYKLLLGPSITRLVSHRVEGEASVVRLNLSDTSQYPNILTGGPTGLYLTTQAYNTLTWQAKIADSAGQPVPNTAIRVSYTTDVFLQNSVKQSIAYTDAQGVATNTITLGRQNCTHERFTTQQAYVQGHKVTYDTGFDTGIWNLSVDGAKIGVGGENVPGVVLGHICTQDVQHVD